MEDPGATRAKEVIDERGCQMAEQVGKYICFVTLAEWWSLTTFSTRPKFFLREKELTPLKDLIFTS